MRAKRSSCLLLAGIGVGMGSGLLAWIDWASAHKAEHTPETLKAFEQIFMQQVEIGDLLFHGDKATADKLGVNLSNTGMAFATLRDMINWCIEKPNQGEVLDIDGPAMKALEAYIYWSNRNSPLRPGTH
jgi:thiosulfate dehydrogenase